MSEELIVCIVGTIFVVAFILPLALTYKAMKSFDVMIQRGTGEETMQDHLTPPVAPPKDIIPSVDITTAPCGKSPEKGGEGV